MLKIKDYYLYVYIIKQKEKKLFWSGRFISRGFYRLSHDNFNRDKFYIPNLMLIPLYALQ